MSSRSRYTGLLNETAESVLRGLPPWQQRAAEHDETKPVREPRVIVFTRHF